MKFEKIGSGQKEELSKAGVSRRNFLRNTAIVAAGSMMPKFLRAEGGESIEVLEKPYIVLGGIVQAKLQSYRTKDKNSQQASPLFFNMHENENTSVNAAGRVMGEFGGRLLELHHGGERLVSGVFEGRNFSFDPNRIFTKKGVLDTLEKYNPKPIPPAVLAEVENFGKQLLADFGIEQEKIIISLHNNFEGGYSADSYRDDGSEAGARGDLYLNKDEDPDNFFYVTSGDDFQKIKAMGYNVVLQNNDAPDDGSLAVVAGQKGIRYINIEAEHHKTDIQEKMIRDIYRFIV